jgi:hypothetical protein
VPGVEEGRIAALIHAHAADLGGGRDGVNLRWSNKPKPGMWIATVNVDERKWLRATGASPLRALVGLEVECQRLERKLRKRGKDNEG